MLYLNWKKILVKKLIASLFLLFPLFTTAKTVRIAVIDSGYYTMRSDFKICDNKPYDFTNTSMEDFVRHGQNVTHIISDNLKDIDYCIIPMKVFAFKGSLTSARNIVNALQTLLTLDVDIINMSLTGDDPIEQEKEAILRLLSKGVTIVVAAGNDNKNLDLKCDIFPACYSKEIITVGNWEKTNSKAETSNYGNYVRFWAIGTEIEAGGLVRSGTSMSTAIISAKIARQLSIINIKLGK